MHHFTHTHAHTYTHACQLVLQLASCDVCGRKSNIEIWHGTCEGADAELTVSSDCACQEGLPHGKGWLHLPGASVFAVAGVGVGVGIFVNHACFWCLGKGERYLCVACLRVSGFVCVCVCGRQKESVRAGEREEERD